jgi:hypothetical protein
MKPVLDKDTETIDPESLKFLDLLIHDTVKGLQSSFMVSFRSIYGEFRTTYAEFRSNLKIRFLTMKKMKNSHPHVPHVPHVPQVQQSTVYAEDFQARRLGTLAQPSFSPDFLPLTGVKTTRT